MKSKKILYYIFDESIGHGSLLYAINHLFLALGILFLLILTKAVCAKLQLF